MAEVVSKEVATKEVKEFLERLDIPVDTHELSTVKPYITAVIAAVQKGLLIFNENETVTQKLVHPLGEGATKEIIYDFRFEIGDFNEKTKGISMDQEVEWGLARLSLLSVEKYPVSVFKKMKRADYYVASKLTVFF